jgi:hypothetical protein
VICPMCTTSGNPCAATLLKCKFNDHCQLVHRYFPWAGDRPSNYGVFVCDECWDAVPFEGIAAHGKETCHFCSAEFQHFRRFDAQTKCVTAKPKMYGKISRNQKPVTGYATIPATVVVLNSNPAVKRYSMDTFPEGSVVCPACLDNPTSKYHRSFTVPLVTTTTTATSAATTTTTTDAVVTDHEPVRFDPFTIAEAPDPNFALAMLRRW